MRRQGKLLPSGYDLQPASNATDVTQATSDLKASQNELLNGSMISMCLTKHSEAEATAADAFRRQIPALKKKPDAIPAILAGMQEHSMHPATATAACKALFHLSSADDDNDDKIANAGGCKLILEAMRAHKTVTDVQEQGCRALKNLAATGEAKKSIAREGGIKVILEAMQEHTKEHSVQEHGCQALMNLAADNYDNKKTVASQGGISIALKAMREHPQNAEIQHHVCRLLLSLTYNNPDLKHQVVGEGGIEEILNAMQTHENHVHVQETGCGALDNIAWSDKVLQKRVKDAGAVRVVEAAMGAHFVGSTDVCRWYGKHLLSNLESV